MKKSVTHRISLWRLFLVIIAVLAIAILTITGIWHESKQSSKPVSSPCRIVQHTMGEACIPLNPQRIITLDSPTLVDVLALLNTKPIATAEYEGELSASYFKGKVEGIQPISSIDGQINLERILLLKPDLIIGESGVSQAIYQQLSKIAPTIFLPWQEISYNWKQRFQEFAVMFDQVEVCNQRMSDYDRRVEALKQILSERYQHIRASVLYVVPGSFYVALKDSFSGSILSEVNLLPSYPATDSSHLPISEETLPEIESQVLFVLQYRKPGVSERFTQLQQHPLWSELKAVQLNQVYSIDDMVWHGYNILAAHAVLDDIEKYLVNTSQANSEPQTSTLP